MVFDKKRYNKEYYKKHKNKWKIYKEKQKEYQKKYMKKYITKYTQSQYHKSAEYRKKAIMRGKARNKIKIPKGQLCQICNKNLAVERHHPDYNKPYEVVFCCKKCHIQLDKINAQ